VILQIIELVLMFMTSVKFILFSYLQGLLLRVLPTNENVFLSYSDLQPSYYCFIPLTKLLKKQKAVLLQTAFFVGRFGTPLQFTT
jgi:hypothetical protein